METPLTLVDRLQACAQAWVIANDASLARLARNVLNDSGFFSRLGGPSPSTTTATLEKFARYLDDGAVWPGGDVPEAVQVFAHVIGTSSARRAASAGLVGQMSGEQEAAE